MAPDARERIPTIAGAAPRSDHFRGAYQRQGYPGLSPMAARPLCEWVSSGDKSFFRLFS